MPKETKTLEQTMRDKFATGYDPIELNVKLKAMNEENLHVVIEGVEYSVRNNEISEVGVRSRVSEPAPDDHGILEEPPTDAAHPVNGGAQASAPPQPAYMPPISHEKYVLGAFNAEELVPAGAAENGDTLFNVVASDGTVLSTGTLQELVDVVHQNKIASGSVAAA